MNWDDLKRSTDLEVARKQAADVLSTPPVGDKDDDRYWYPSVDKAGNGMAVIRFLPPPAIDGNDGLAWIRVFNHGFQAPGGWLIDKCLTTLGQQCPVCDHNTILWNSGTEANKEIVRKQKRKLTYISNVYVISDPANPENEGKIKLFKYGKKIFDFINEAMNPPFPDMKPFVPFDFWRGANFKLRMRNVDGYRSYDKSEFETPGPMFEDDEKMKEIWTKEYSLAEIISPEKFNTFDKIKTRLDTVLGIGKVAPAPPPQQAPQQEASQRIDTPTPQSSTDTGGDKDLDYFRSLANAGDDVPF